jgi:type 2 lantibiotic biosynthesis protein LanM
METSFDRPVRLRGDHTHENNYWQAFTDSMLRTGLLPFRAAGPGGIYDVSAFGASGEQPGFSEVTVVENRGRDDARLVPAPAKIQQEVNAPLLDGTRQQLADHQTHFLSGIRAARRVFATWRADLLEKDGPLARFTWLPVRYVFRSTRDYVDILSKITHPAVLGDALHCDMLIWADLRTGLRRASHVHRLLPSEVAALWELDVPYFASEPASCDAVGDDGSHFKQIFSQSGMREAQRRLGEIPAIDRFQDTVIERSIQSMGGAVGPATESPAPEGGRSDQPLRIASDIGEAIWREAHVVRGVPFWSGFVPLQANQYGCGVIRPSLYDGAPGIGLFFAHLFRQTREEKWRSIAASILQSLREQLASRSDEMMCGAYSGLSGLVYAAMHIGAALQITVEQEIAGCLSKLARLVEADRNCDIVAGAAGALLVALRVNEAFGLDAALAAADRAASQLRKSANHSDHHCTWSTLASEKNPLGGMAHGVMGIAWALTEWSNRSDCSSSLAVARKALAYQQSLFDEELRTWRDPRGGRIVSSWCFGAAGIGLAADRMSSAIEPAVRARLIEVAQDSTWLHETWRNHCLCHGSLGDLEIYRINDPERTSHSFERIMRDLASTKPYALDLPGNGSTPGLMCGLAGVGLGLLRHISPDTVPNVLTLEPPSALLWRLPQP